MMLFLLLAAAEPRTALDAERAFAADAQTMGQWTAFRRWAAPNATMFLPRPKHLPDALEDWRDPPQSVRWQPAASYLSCDGRMAANTGPWQNANGSTGFFSTIWIHGAGGWRWTVDGGDQLKAPRTAPITPAVTRASCTGTPPTQAISPPDRLEVSVGYGHAADNTIQWRYRVEPDGARVFAVELWDGTAMRRVIDDHIAAPPPAPPRP